MEEKIRALKEQLEADAAGVRSKEELSAFWQKYLGKNGSVAGLMKGLRDVPKEERPAAGKTINECKAWAEARYQQLNAEIERIELEGRGGGHHPARDPPGDGQPAPHHAGQKPDRGRFCRHGL